MVNHVSESLCPPPAWVVGGALCRVVLRLEGRDLFPRRFPIQAFIEGDMSMRHTISFSGAFSAHTLEGAQREAHGPVGRPLLKSSCDARVHRHAAHVVPVHRWETVRSDPRTRKQHAPMLRLFLGGVHE